MRSLIHVSSRLLPLLAILMLSSCVRPNEDALSGGKKLATDEALKAIDDAYAHITEQPSGKEDISFPRIIEHVRHAASFAMQAGDPSRKADIQVSIDLDYCVTALSNYSYSHERGDNDLKTLGRVLEDFISKLHSDLGEAKP